MKTIVNILLACMLTMVVIGTASAGSIQLSANEVRISGLTKAVAPDENGEIEFTAKLKGWPVGTNYSWTIFDTCKEKTYYYKGITDAKPYIVSEKISVEPGCEYIFTVNCLDWNAQQKGKTIAGTVQITPEPATIAMTAIGLFAVLGFVFKRRED